MKECIVSLVKNIFSMKAELVKRQDRWDLYGEDGSKIASSAPNPMGKLSIKNCEEIYNGLDMLLLLHFDLKTQNNTLHYIKQLGLLYLLQGI